MTTSNESEKQKRGARYWVGKLVRGVVRMSVAAAIVAAALLAYKHQMNTSPRAQRKKPPRQAKLVQVIQLEREDQRTVVDGMGPVIPAQRVTLQPQVSGKIVEVSPHVVPGHFVREGEKLLQIDERDYEILVKQRESDVAAAAKNLRLEEGSQAVAKQEYALLDEVVEEMDEELVLRKPQLEQARAALESAEAALRKAKLDLARCEITAPFNAIVRERHVDVGATVGSNSQLVTLVGTDEAWIELKVGVDDLQWITIPQDADTAGSQVTISSKIWGPGRTREGRVTRLYGELETQGRMAQLLVVVEDPFSVRPENADKPRLLMGSYVRGDIEGRTLSSVFAIDWSHRRDKDTVWIMNEEGRLEVRPVEIVFRGPEHVYVKQGLAEGEHLVVTDIAAPVEGMPLRVAGSADGQMAEGETPSGGGGPRS